MWAKCASGAAKVESGVLVCRCTFDRWHCVHVRAQFLTSVLILGHTNRAVTNRCVALIPGCERECKESKTRIARNFGGQNIWRIGQNRF